MSFTECLLLRLNLFEQLFRIAFKEADKVYHGKEQIAEFFVNFPVIAAGDCRSGFADLLIDFIKDILIFYPVETSFCGLFLNFFSAGELR